MDAEIYHNIDRPPCTNQQTCFWQAAQVCQTKNKDFTKNINKYVHPNGKHKPFILAILSNLTNINGGGKKY